MVNWVQWLELITSYGILLFLLVGYIVTYFRGSKELPKARAKIIDGVKPHLKGRVKKFSIIEHTAENLELKCEPKLTGVRALSVFITLKSRTAFHSVLIGKLMHDTDKIILALKFGRNNQLVEPDHKLYLVPYRNKFIIRRRFDEFVKIDDFQTKSKWINEHYMVKTTNFAQTRGLLNQKQLHALLKKTEKHLSYILLSPPESPTEPHLQMEFDYSDDQEMLKACFDLFFMITEYYETLKFYRPGTRKPKKKKSS